MKIYIGNFLGFIAIVLFVLSYQLKKRKSIIVCNAVSRSFYVMQYVVLGAFSGAVLDSVGVAISALVVNKQTRYKNIKKIMVILLYMVIVASSIFMSDDIFSVFSFIGVTLELSAFLFSREKYVRIVSLVSQPFWLVYNLHFFALSSALGNCIAIVSIVISMCRYDFKIFGFTSK